MASTIIRRTTIIQMLLLISNAVILTCQEQKQCCLCHDIQSILDLVVELESPESPESTYGSYDANFTVEIQKDNLLDSFQTKLIPIETGTEPKKYTQIGHLPGIADYRLPKTVVPEHYNIDIHPSLDPENLEFEGLVTVYFNCIAPSTNITINARKLVVHKIEVADLGHDGHSLQPGGPQVTSVDIDRIRDFLIVQLSEEMVVGSHYSLTIKYTGLHTHSNRHFYSFARGGYKTELGELRPFLVSQFEAFHARRAFPCFDEPDLKATFNVSLTRPENMTALSNMPILRSSPRDDGQVTDYFSQSVKMSTYLVGFTVFDFEYQEAKTKRDVVVRIWATPDKVRSAAFAANEAARTVDFLEEYLDVPYPIPKLDIIAVPRISFGAMENWGMITAAEHLMIYDADEYSPRTKFNVQVYLYHEIAHQWFGNIVTAKWWNEIWLNEGLTSYMEVRINEGLNPLATDTVLKQINSMINGAMVTDGNLGTHPLSTDDELLMSAIPGRFSSISYSKGAVISRMMESLIGEKVFWKGIQSYLKAMKYKNSERKDLFEHLDESIREAGLDIDIKQVMNYYITETGFPLINVTRDYENRTAYIRQIHLTPTEEQQKLRFEIPITFTTASQQDFNISRPKYWLRSTDDVLILTEEDGIPEADEWVIFNIQRSGYYVVNYDRTNWKLLLNYIIEDFKKLPILHRGQIQQDFLILLHFNQLTKHHRQELVALFLEYSVLDDQVLTDALWSTINIYDSLKQTPNVHYLQSLLHDVLEKVWEKVGHKSILSWDVPSPYSFENIACEVGVKDCVALVKQGFDAWMEEPDRSYVMMRTRLGKLSRLLLKDGAIVMCAAVRNGGEKEWQFIWSKYIHLHSKNYHSDPMVEKYRLALACTYNPWLLARYLAAVLNPDHYGFDASEGLQILEAVAVVNVFNRQMVFNFVKENMSTLQKKYSALDLIRSFGYSMNSDLEFKELAQFIACLPKEVIVENEREFAMIFINIKNTKRYLTRVISKVNYEL